MKSYFTLVCQNAFSKSF